MKIIEPSLLSMNKDKAIEQLKRIQKLGLKLIHYDVMDGQFVPPTSFTNEYLMDLEKLGIKANVHLMVKDPLGWIDKYKSYKLNSITFHVETQSIEDAKKIIGVIHDCGFLAGISAKPKTDLNLYKELFADCDLILVMSVEPGWGGQGFLSESMDNIIKANEAKKHNPHLILQIDGGINMDKIKELYKQIDWFVTGSWFFKNIDHMDQYLLEFNNLK